MQANASANAHPDCFSLAAALSRVQSCKCQTAQWVQRCASGWMWTASCSTSRAPVPLPWIRPLPPLPTPPGPFHAKLAVLIGRRHQIDKQRTSLKMSLADVPECAAQIRTLKNAFKRLLATIDAQINAAFAGEHELQLQRQRLCTIHGFGPLVSAAV